MENIGIRYVKAAEIYKDNLLALEIVQIIEAEANFYVRIFWFKIRKIQHRIIIVLDRLFCSFKWAC